MNSISLEMKISYLFGDANNVYILITFQIRMIVLVEYNMFTIKFLMMYLYGIEKQTKIQTFILSMKVNTIQRKIVKRTI